MRTPRLGIAWQIGSYSGWGVYGLQIALHAIRSGMDAVPFGDMQAIDRAAVASDCMRHLEDQHRAAADALARIKGDRLVATFPVLHGLGNSFVSSSLTDSLTGRPDYGVVFLEDTALASNALERARRYARIVAGSSWNGAVLQAAGLDNVVVQPQGVALDVFRPGPASGALANRFVIFSGGKFEYRKGQDIVVEAFRRFHARHPEALLLAAWYNPWPQLAAGMARSRWVSGSPLVDEQGRMHLSTWLRAQGLPDSAFRVQRPLPNSGMAGALREADVALFPNRCEGGTNMVAMECLACGVPTILSANTGHLDLVHDIPCYPLRRQPQPQPEPPEDGVEGWGESDIEEILDQLERIHTDRAAARDVGRKAAARMHAEWGWHRQLERLFGHLDIPTGKSNGQGSEARPSLS